MKRIFEKYFTYIAIAAAIAVVSIIVALYALRPDAGGTPQVVLPAPASGGGEGQFPGPDQSGGEQIIEINQDTVLAALATITRAESYSRSVRVLRYSSHGSSEQRVDLWVRGTSVRVVETDGWETRNLLITGGELWVWYGDAGAYYKGQADGGYQGIPDINEVLRLEPDSISEAAYVLYEDEACMYLSYTSGVFGYSYRVYISALTGLVMGAETYDGDELIYQMHSLETDISTPEDGVFAPPAR